MITFKDNSLMHIKSCPETVVVCKLQTCCWGWSHSSFSSLRYWALFYGPEWPQIYDPFASTSWLLGLQVWATMPSSLPLQLDLRDEDIKTQWATPRSGAWALSGPSLLMWKIQKNQLLRWQLKQLSFTPNRTVWHLNRMWGACKTPRPTPSWKELY